MKEKIKLPKKDLLWYYKTPLVLLFITLFCFSNGLENPLSNNFKIDNSLLKIGTITSIVSILFYFFLHDKLKIKLIQTEFNTKQSIELIKKYVDKNEDWNLITEKKDIIIIETKGSFEKYNNSRNILVSPNEGNRIFIFLKNNKYFVRSIHNLSRNSIFSINNGKNNQNENIIIDIIKSTANSV